MTKIAKSGQRGYKPSSHAQIEIHQLADAAVYASVRCGFAGVDFDGLLGESAIPRGAVGGAGSGGARGDAGGDDSTGLLFVAGSTGITGLLSKE